MLIMRFWNTITAAFAGNAKPRKSYLLMSVSRVSM
jgi:hypothetical protein